MGMFAAGRSYVCGYGHIVCLSITVTATLYVLLFTNGYLATRFLATRLVMRAGWVMGVHTYGRVCCLYPLRSQTATLCLMSMIALQQKSDLKQTLIKTYCYELPAIGCKQTLILYKSLSQL